MGNFDMRVLELLREGYGVEDIAVKFVCDPELVRRAIQRLREKDMIRKMYEVKP